MADRDEFSQQTVYCYLNTMDRKIQEQKLLQEELKTLRKGASVYKQQPNSNIFFKTTRDMAFSDSKRAMDSLIQEYKEAETLQAKEEPGEEKP